MRIDEIVERLDQLDGTRDPERDHGVADDLLLAALNKVGQSGVVDAYGRLVERARWWAGA